MYWDPISTEKAEADITSAYMYSTGHVVPEVSMVYPVGSYKAEVPETFKRYVNSVHYFGTLVMSILVTLPAFPNSWNTLTPPQKTILDTRPCWPLMLTTALLDTPVSGKQYYNYINGEDKQEIEHQSYKLKSSDRLVEITQSTITKLFLSSGGTWSPAEGEGEGGDILTWDLKCYISETPTTNIFVRLHNHTLAQLLILASASPAGLNAAFTNSLKISCRNHSYRLV